VATRRATPYLLVGLGLVAAAAVGYVLWRRSRRDSDD
jgi:LPXTG-motif cell wall-anchored protein